jgi:hypothetical protein
MRFLLHRRTTCVEICLYELFRSYLDSSDGVRLPRTKSATLEMRDEFFGQAAPGPLVEPFGCTIDDSREFQDGC